MVEAFDQAKKRGGSPPLVDEFQIETERATSVITEQSLTTLLQA